MDRKTDTAIMTIKRFVVFSICIVNMYHCMMGYQVMGLPLLIVHVHNQRNIYKVVRSHVFTKISYYKHTDGFILDNLGLLRVNYS